MKKAELEKYRRILLEKQRILAVNVQAMEKSALESPLKEATGDLTNLPTHIADLSADTFSQNLTIELIENGEEVMKEIVDALKRIDDKTFGICAECESEIPAKRLEHIPYARLCVCCKIAEEKNNRRWKPPR